MRMAALDREVDDHRPTKRTLLAAANSCATTARYGAIALSALVGYIFVTIASLTHKDLLLNTPVMLPFLEVQIPLVRFFIFAPILLLVIHSLVLVQHVILRGMIQAFNQSLGDGSPKDDPLRLELSSYFFVQSYAGPKRPAVIGTLLFSASWLTLVLLPVLAFLYFQIAFLPRHFTAVTWAHRIYLTVDLLLLFVTGTLILFPEKDFLSAPLHKLIYSPLLSLSVHSTILFALFFSFCVATLPDSGMDRFMRGLSWRAGQLALKSTGGEANEEFMPQGFVFLGEDAERPVFSLTAWLFEGAPDFTTGKTKSLFARNLIVMNTDLVPDDDTKERSGEVSLLLRGRDLRYARLDGSDLHRADLTGADLSHATLVEANLSNANLHKADLRSSNLNWAKLNGAVLREAKLQHAALREAELVKADLRNAKMQKAILSWAEMTEANLSRADMRKAVANWAELDRAKLIWTDLEDASLFAASLRDANLEFWHPLRTVLRNADFGTIKEEELARVIRTSLMSGHHELRGVWSGEAAQPEFASKGKSYLVELTINEFGTALVDYPGLKCAGRDSGVKYKNFYVFEERIDKGRDYCRDGHVKMHISESGKELYWSWYDTRGRLGATAVLKKRE